MTFKSKELCIISQPFQIRRFMHHFFASCDFEILRMTLKNNRAPLLCPLKLHASFGSHRWIPIWVTVPKRTNWVLTSVTLTSDLWRTDRRTDGQADRTIHRAAWLQLKIAVIILCIGSTFGNIYSKYATVYCGYHFSFDYVCSSAIMYMCDFWCQNIY